MLAKNIATGAAWLLTLKFIMRGIGVVSTFLLVRLLSPEDFGLNAIAMSIFGFVELLSRFGFDTVLIQKQDADHNHYDTAWSLNVCFGLLACLLILLFSSFVTNFYGDPRLRSILYCVSVLFLINGFLNIGIVDFRKNLTFDKEFKLQIFPKVISFVVTIAIAYIYRNYWALVVGTLVWKGLILLMSYIMSSYRPKLRFTAWRDLFDFSKWIFIGNFFNFLNVKTPELLIARIISPAATGYMAVSREISDFATSELVSNVNRAAYPGYSKISHDLKQLRELYSGVMSNILFWAFPAGIGLSSVASLLVPVVLGDQWTDTIPLIQCLAIASMIFSLNSNTSYIFLAVGKPRTNVIMSLIRVSLFIPLLLYLLSTQGILGGAYAILIASFITMLLYNYVVMTELKIKLKAVVSIYFRPLLSSWLMALGIYLFKENILIDYQINNIYALLTCVFLGVMLYSVTTLSLWCLGGRKQGPEKSILVLLKNRFSS